MRSFLHHLQLYLATERLRLRRKVRSAAATLVLFIATCIVFVFALGFGLFGIYRYLAEYWTHLAAGLTVAGALLLVAAGMLLVVFRKSPSPGLGDEGYYRQTAPAEEQESDSALHLGEAVGQTVRRSTTSAGDLAVAALLVGIVLGASPALRGTRRHKEDRRRNPD
jgi:hypothetical protein